MHVPYLFQNSGGTHVATTKEIADSILGIKTRLDQLFVSNNWSRTNPIVSVVGGYAPPLSVETIGVLAESVAARINALSKADLDRNGLGRVLVQCPGAGERR